MDVAAVGIDVGVVAAVGGAVALDRRAAFQTMLSQPLAAVPLLGLLMGDVATGVWLGALLQLLWMSSAMFGANVPPNETVASVIIGGAVLIAARYGPAPDVIAYTVAILFGVPFAFLGRRIEVWLDHRNLRLAASADADGARIGRLVWLSVARAYVLYAWVIAAGTGIVTAAVWWIALGVAGPPRAAIASIGVYGIPALALAVALTGLSRRRAWVLAAASFGGMVVMLGGAPVNAAPAVKARVSAGALLQVLWRTFFFQAANNYERMQNLGFAYCMCPALKQLYSGGDLDAARARHLGFFNSHPYLSAAVLGATIKLEEQVASGALPPARVESFKRMTMGPLAAVGDSFFWTCLKPFAATWAIAGALSGILWAPLAFLALYNLFHLTIRIYGLVAGYRRGEAVVLEFNKLELPRLGMRGQLLTGLFIGVIAALLADRATSSTVALGGHIETILLVALTVIFALSLKRKIPLVVLLYGFTAGCIALVLGLNALFPLL